MKHTVLSMTILAMLLLIGGCSEQSQSEASMEQEQRFSTHEEMTDHLKENNLTVVSIKTSTNEQFYMLETSNDIYELYKTEDADEYTLYPVTSGVHSIHGFGAPLGDHLRFELNMIDEDSTFVEFEFSEGRAFDIYESESNISVVESYEELEVTYFD